MSGPSTQSQEGKGPRGIGWVLGFVLIGWIGVWLARPVFGVLVLSLATAWLLDPVVDNWEARGRKREVGILLIFGSFLVILATILFWLSPVVVQEVREGIDHLRGALASAPERLGGWAERLEQWFGVSIGAESGSEFLGSSAPEGWVSTLFDLSFRGGAGAFLVLMNLLMFPVFSYYLLRDWDKLWAWLDGLVPERNRAHARGLAESVDEKLGGFFWGQLVVAGALTLMYTAGLWAVGLDASVSLGVLAGAVSLVPYLGLVVGLGASMGACLLQFGIEWQVGAVLGVFLAAQAVETLLVTPRVMGERVGLHPLMVMVVIIAGGSSGGVFGMLIAVPVAALAQVLVSDFVRAYRDSEFYRGPA